MLVETALQITPEKYQSTHLVALARSLARSLSHTSAHDKNNKINITHRKITRMQQLQKHARAGAVLLMLLLLPESKTQATQKSERAPCTL